MNVGTKKMLLAHILCIYAKMHSTEGEAMQVRLFLSTLLRLAKGLSVHKYTTEMFFSPSSAWGMCAASREAIASAVFCCLQQEAGSAMPTSSTCSPSVSSERSWADKVPPARFMVQCWSPASSHQWPETIAIDFQWEHVGELKWLSSPW